MMSTQTVDQKVIKTIRGHGRGWVFTPTNFSSLGTRSAVASALKRYKRDSVIVALTRGLYCYPRVDLELGTLEPTNDQIARALAGRDAIRLQPTGAHAANLLGLSSQVPATVVYLTDGRSREVVLKHRRIRLKHTTPQAMATAGSMSGLVIQALRHFGREQITAATVNQLRSRLTAVERYQLLKDVRYAPAWVADVMRAIALNAETD